MKKELDLTECTSTEQMCSKIEKELTPKNNKSKKNKKKAKNNTKMTTEEIRKTTEEPATCPCDICEERTCVGCVYAKDVAEEAKNAPKKQTLWQKVKNWFKKLF